MDAIDLQAIFLDAIWYLYIFVGIVLLVTKFAKQNDGVWALVGIMCLLLSFGSAIIALNMVQDPAIYGDVKNVYFQSTVFISSVMFGSFGSRFISNWLLK